VCHFLVHPRGLFPTNVFREEVGIEVHGPAVRAESDGEKEGSSDGDHYNNKAGYRSGKTNRKTEGGDGQAKSGKGQNEEDRGADGE
jgi:hypothetical protein